jgi:hypothetical protein
MTNSGYLAKVYPNPACNDLLISFDNMPNMSFDLMVYNTVGGDVKNIKSRNKQTIININDLPSGTYILKIMGGNVNQVSKIEVIR